MNKFIYDFKTQPLNTKDFISISIKPEKYFKSFHYIEFIILNLAEIFQRYLRKDSLKVL